MNDTSTESKEHTGNLSLSERIQKRAQTRLPDKQPPVIRKIIEARSVIAQQRLRGQSWHALADILEAEGVHLGAGTLRNYMAKIGKAEISLQDAGTPLPTDDEIHAALRQPQTKGAVAPGPAPHPAPGVQAGVQPSTPHAPSRPHSALPNASVTRKLNREP